MPSHETGFVYVLRNPAMPDLVKIGFTTSLPEDRAGDLSKHTAVPLPFQVAFSALTMRWRAVERLVHQRLDDHRVSRKEFFGVPVTEAVKTVRECVLDVDGVEAWQPDTRHLVRDGDRVALSLEAGQVFVLLSMPSLFAGDWTVVDLWQAHSSGDQLEIYGTGTAGDVTGFSDGDQGGDEDPVPYLDRARNTVNGTLNGKERLAPGDRLLWLADADDGGEGCKSVLFEAWDHCQVASRTWSPQWTREGFPLVLNALVRDPSPPMLEAVRAAMALPAPRNWAPRCPAREEIPSPLPDPERWLPQLSPRRTRRRRAS